MSKEVTVQELIANIEAHVAEVKKGESLTIVDEGKPVATITPHVKPFRDLKFGPPPERLRTDPVDVIREDRDYERKKHGF